MIVMALILSCVVTGRQEEAQPAGCADGVDAVNAFNGTTRRANADSYNDEDREILCEEDESCEEDSDPGDGEYIDEPWPTQLQGRGQQRRSVSKRVKARAGKAAQEAAEEAARKGNGAAFPRTLERMFKDDTHGKGGQAKLFSRFGRSLPSRTRLPESTCHSRCSCDSEGNVLQEGMVMECAKGLNVLLESATHCHLSVQDQRRFGRSQRDDATPVYNMSKLKRHLVANAFQLNGNPRVHLQCLTVNAAFKRPSSFLEIYALSDIILSLCCCFVISPGIARDRRPHLR